MKTQDLKDPIKSLRMHNDDPFGGHHDLMKILWSLNENRMKNINTPYDDILTVLSRVYYGLTKSGNGQKYWCWCKSESIEDSRAIRERERDRERERERGRETSSSARRQTKKLEGWSKEQVKVSTNLCCYECDVGHSLNNEIANHYML